MDTTRTGPTGRSQRLAAGCCLYCGRPLADGRPKRGCHEACYRNALRRSRVVPGHLERLARVQAQGRLEHRQDWRPIHDDWAQWQHALTIDRQQTEAFIAQLPAKSNAFGGQSLLVSRLHRRDYRLTVDDYGRVHNSMSNLKRNIRHALRIHGEPMGHIDIVNSQPALLAVLMRHAACGEMAPPVSGGAATRGASSARRQAASLSAQESLVLEAPPPPISSRYDRAPFSPIEVDAGYERLATGGELYEHLMMRTGMPRERVKKRLQSDVFAKRGGYASDFETAFREDFPVAHSYIRSFNRDSHAALLRQLQRLESDLVIQRVGRRLKELGCSGCVSLHDAVYCARSDIEIVEQAFRDAVTSMQMQIKLKVER